MSRPRSHLTKPVPVYALPTAPTPPRKSYEMGIWDPDPPIRIAKASSSPIAPSDDSQDKLIDKKGQTTLKSGLGKKNVANTTKSAKDNVKKKVRFAYIGFQLHC